jgi:hypothetical protein
LGGDTDLSKEEKSTSWILTSMIIGPANVLLNMEFLPDTKKVGSSAKTSEMTDIENKNSKKNTSNFNIKNKASRC